VEAQGLPVMTVHDKGCIKLLAVPGNFEFVIIFSVGFNDEADRFEELASIRMNVDSVMTHAEIADHLRIVAARLDNGEFTKT